MPASELQVPYDSNNFTPDEAWTTVRDVNHWYAYQADYALESLGRGTGSLLIIGSPIFEAVEFENNGWDVTYMDVRQPPLIKNYLPGDISTADLPPETFDAVSSTCVLCHAGMGRYGDQVVKDAELKSLENIYKTLKKGSRAAITFGPVSGQDFQVRWGNMQRIFTVPSAKRLCYQAGFQIMDVKIRDLKQNKWVEEFSELGSLDRHYLSMTLRK